MLGRLIFALALVAAAVARAVAPEEAEFFEKHVRPVLAEHCYKCHGPEKQKADLRVDSRAALLQGSDLGPALVPGHPEESALIRSIRHEGDTAKMPEKAPKLPDAAIAALSEWVKMGAPWPEHVSGGASAQELARRHWAWLPIAKPPIPANGKPHPIDAFVVAKLAEKKLTLSPPADTRTLARRASFSLTGLPPEPSSIQHPASSIEPLIDSLLASPTYGERWARHWLDVARYADTRGYLAGGEERRYPFAWVYRDWVVQALNADLPYDQFLVQQIAGDQLATEKDPAPLAAMGFLLVGRRFLNNPHDIIDDRLDVLTRGTMGFTLTCARCHDHKFDPISQRDYYGLYGVFASSEEATELPLVSGFDDAGARGDYEKQRAKHDAEMHRYLSKKSAEWLLALSGATGVPVFIPPLGREDLKPLFNRKDRDDTRQILNKYVNLDATAAAPPRAMVLRDRRQPVEPHIFRRGNPGNRGDKVPRQFPRILAGENAPAFAKGSGRLELARAIASAENPLTARVIVNRVWAYHFGRGLVRTPSDFGVKGELPTHPELLDFLASWFIENGWSLKKLHRLILTSATWQQRSDDRADARALDPENTLLWRQNRQRLDFEAMRDAMLAASGRLDGKLGGRPIDLTDAKAARRSLYGLIDRQNLPGVFRTFDFASPDQTSPQRYQTTVPTQALFFLNGAFAQEQARALVSRDGFTRDSATPAQVAELYQRVLGRAPEPVEADATLAFLAKQLAPAPDGKPRADAWEKTAQALLATNEFLFVD